MPRDRDKPGDILLDMLRGASDSGRTAAWLIETGELFGFSENIVRVTLSRLQTRGLIESPARGRYRLAATADPVNEFVERWRLGEDRVRPWDDQTWLLAHAPAPDEKCTWALDALGFRAVRDQLLVRPDNLSLSLAELHRLAGSIGLAAGTLIVSASVLPVDADDWLHAWNADALNRDYREMTDRLRASADHLSRLGTEAARLETFRLGGAAIHLLAKDPLLPDSHVDVAARRELWVTLKDYDARGTAIWAASRRERGDTLPVPRLANLG